MTCDRLEALWIEYLDGRLAAGDRATLERHLASCAGCAERVRDFRAVSAALDSWEAPEVSPWFDARLRRRIAAEAAGPWGWLGRLRAALRPAYALGLAAVLLAGSLVIWNRRPALVAHNAPAPKPTAVEKQRLEEIMPVVEDYDILANFEMLGELKQEKNKL